MIQRVEAGGDPKQFLALFPFLLWSCRADDPTTHGVKEPGVLVSGYWIPDGIGRYLWNRVYPVIPCS